MQLNRRVTRIVVIDLKPFPAPRPKKTDLVAVSTPPFVGKITAPNHTIERGTRKSGERLSL